MDVRRVHPSEWTEAGRVTALAYREFITPGENEWESYLDEITDVAARANVAEVFVAVEDDRILGSVTLELGERLDDEDPPLAQDEAHVRMIGVHPAARRRGVARALMDACFDAARGAGRTRMTLHTTLRMPGAQAMYEAMGFERLPDRVLQDGFVLLTYHKPIPH